MTFEVRQAWRGYRRGGAAAAHSSVTLEGRFEEKSLFLEPFMAKNRQNLGIHRQQLSTSAKITFD